MKDAFFANLSAPQAVVPVKSDVQAVELPTTSKVKTKLKLRKKVDDNPFESDNEESETLLAKKSIANKAKRTEIDNEKGEEPLLAPEPKKGAVKVKAKRACSSDDEDNGGERRKKKRAAAKR